ncbi:MAG: glycoside hydrolase family 9 protein, partial [Lachnospiraceae bacterium]
NDPGEHTIVFDNFDFQCIDESGRIKPEAAVETPDIQINQIGYRPDDVKKAAAYLDKNDNQPFTNPEEIVTGEYPDNFDADERFWAYAELFKATGDPAYETAASDIDLEKVKYGLGWADVGYYATYAYLTSDYTNASFAKNVMTKMDDGAAQIVKNIGKDTYGCSIFKDYVWGSNILAADNGMMLSLYAEVSGKDYSTETKAQLDYLLGNNGNSYCFLTGYGTLTPEGTHHRPSQVLGTTLKGMLVGGPNAGLEDPYAAAVLKGKPQALCYVDNSQSYSCNEITVYWNSPLIYLLAEAK